MLNAVGVGLKLKALQEKCRKEPDMYADEEIFRGVREMVIMLTGGPQCNVDGHVIDKITTSVIDGWARESEW